MTRRGVQSADATSRENALPCDGRAGARSGRSRGDSFLRDVRSYSRALRPGVPDLPVPDLVLSPLAIIAGCILLYVGGDMLVSASTLIADRIGMSPIAIGATIVAVGTSAPELSVSLGAALTNHGDVSVGNVVGSNVCNIIFVLGLCGLFSQLRASRDVVRLDFPILIVVSGVFTFMISDHVISRLEGLLLVVGLGVYVVWNLRRAAEDTEMEELITGEVAEVLRAREARRSWVGPVLRTIFGILFLGLGARWLVSGSLRALSPFDLSEAAIGLTIVALGTSVPEIGTSIIAARKGHGDLAVGNAIGSSVFNLLGVLGLTACITPLSAYDVSLVDGAILIAVSLAGLVLVARPQGIGRVQGSVLVTAYTVYLVLAVAPPG